MRDVAVIGAGHNGLVCAALLARAGLDVVVLEANDEPGGCIWTEETETGHRLEVGAIEMTMIGDVAAELDLEAHGLELVERHSLVAAAFGDATLEFTTDLDATVDGLAGVDTVDRHAYRAYADLAADAFAALDTLPGVPTFEEVVTMSGALASAVDLPRLLVSSSEAATSERIGDARLASAITMYGAHAQLPPWAPGTGMFSLLLPGSHGLPSTRAIGGSARVISALVASLEAAGGALLTGARVESISYRDRATLRMRDGEEVVARRVVSSIDVARTVALMGDPPASLLRAAATVRSGAFNIAEIKIDLGLSVPASLPGPAADEALWLLQERPDSMRVACAEILAGRLPSTAAMMWAAPSVQDPTAAPDGGGTVWLSAFVPAERADGRWDGDGEEEAAERVLDGFAAITGVDLRPHTVARRITGPRTWAARMGSSIGNPNHIDLTLDQMFAWRPPGASGHRTDLPWLYLSGAGTFPGGGVTGDPGRRTADSVLGDLTGRRRSRSRGELRRLWDAFGAYRSVRRRR